MNDTSPTNPPSRFGRWYTRLFMALVVVPLLALLALSVVEHLGFMDGERVLELEATVDGDEPCQIEVTQPGEEHTVEIHTRKLKLAIRIEDPAGETIYEASAFRRSRSRCLSFVPEQAGTYSLFLERGGKLSISLGSSSPSNAEVEVFLDDGRFAEPLLTSFGL